MPQISMFYGIAIYLYWDDHDPPHFHAFYGEHRAKFNISDGKLAKGTMPGRQRKLIKKWAHLHQADLEHAWELIQDEQEPGRIDPLR